MQAYYTRPRLCIELLVGLDKDIDTKELQRLKAECAFPVCFPIEHLHAWWAGFATAVRNKDTDAVTEWEKCMVTSVVQFKHMIKDDIYWHSMQRRESSRPRPPERIVLCTEQCQCLSACPPGARTAGHQPGQCRGRCRFRLEQHANLPGLQHSCSQCPSTPPWPGEGEGPAPTWLRVELLELHRRNLLLQQREAREGSGSTGADGPERARRSGEQAAGETGGMLSDEEAKGEDDVKSTRQVEFDEFEGWDYPPYDVTPPHTSEEEGPLYPSREVMGFQMMLEEELMEQVVGDTGGEPSERSDTPSWYEEDPDARPPDSEEEAEAFWVREDARREWERCWE